MALSGLVVRSVNDAWLTKRISGRVAFFWASIGALIKYRVPRVRLTDVVWNLDTGVLWLWSQAKGVNEAFLELFAKSCALKLDIDGPARWVRDAKLRRGLETLEPTPELWAGFPGVRPLGGATEVA